MIGKFLQKNFHKKRYYLKKGVDVEVRETYSQRQ